MIKRLIATIAFALLATPAAADGTLSTYVCGQMPAAYRMEVQVGDDSDQMLRIQDASVGVLMRKQAEDSGSAKLVLAIETETTREGAIRKKRDLGSVRDGSSENVNVRMNLYSNRRDSIIGGRKVGIVTDALEEVRVLIRLNDKTNGKCIWRGEAVYDSAGADQWDVAEKMTLHLIDLIGKDLRDRKFEVD